MKNRPGEALIIFRLYFHVLITHVLIVSDSC